jgi:hypothetical protein
MGEEDEIPTTDITNLFTESDNEVNEVVGKVLKAANRELINMFSPGLTGPGDVGSNQDISLSNILELVSNPNIEEMSENEYLKYIKILARVKRAIYNKAIQNNDSQMHEIMHKMMVKSANPFIHSDVAEIVREMD